jgi:hypothetical protein
MVERGEGGRGGIRYVPCQGSSKNSEPTVKYSVASFLSFYEDFTADRQIFPPTSAIITLNIPIN